MSSAGLRGRAALLVLAGCLLAALAAGSALGATAPAGGDASQAVVQIGNTSNYLQPDSGERTREAVDYQSVDVGVAVASDADELSVHMDRLAADRRITSASDDGERLERARAAVEDLEDRTAAIRAAQEQAREGFLDGSLSAREYAYRMSRLDARVDSASDTRDLLERRVTDVDPSAQRTLTTLQTLETDLNTMRGPVSDRIRERFRGNETGGGTLVRATDEGGFVYATATDRDFYREAQETAEWNRGGLDRLDGDFTAAYELIQNQYPWTFSNSFGSDSPSLLSGTPLYRLSVVHQHGELTVFLDGSRESVFREVQRNRINSVPRTWQQSDTAEGMELTVEGTNPTGSLTVEVTRATSDAPVDAEVRIDDVYVGSTDDEGTLQTVHPSGSFTVNATSGDDSVTVTYPEDGA